MTLSLTEVGILIDPSVAAFDSADHLLSPSANTLPLASGAVLPLLIFSPSPSQSPSLG